MRLPVQTPENEVRCASPLGAMEAHVSVPGSYRPLISVAPGVHEIMTLPVQSTNEPERSGSGCPTADMSVQVFVTGSYEPPVLGPLARTPPQTSILVPVHTAPCASRAVGASRLVIGDQVLVVRSYFAPSDRSGRGKTSERPPQTRMCVPLKATLGSRRGLGGVPALEKLCQVSVAGS